jgi:hypothetical protein
MRRAFTEVTEVTAPAEAVWAAVAGPLDAAAAELNAGRPLVAGLGPDLEAEFREAETALGALRAAANADPLALWRDGRTDTADADRLRERVAALTPRIAELDRVRQQASRRIDDLRAAVAAAQADRRDAVATWQQAAARISELPPRPADPAPPPLASLRALAAGGQWSRLAAELDRCAAELAGDRAETAALRGSAAAAIGRRDELRGLLGAYKAKAARLGAAENADLVAQYDQAYSLLWTAPCDLTAANAAVAAYQRAILATEGRR